MMYNKYNPTRAGKYMNLIEFAKMDIIKESMC